MAGLAAAINAQAPSDITALAEGNQLFIVNRAGHGVDGGVCGGAGGEPCQRAAAPARERDGRQRGARRRLYAVSLASGAASVSYTAVATDTAATVAKALAALINNSTDPDAAPFSGGRQRGAALHRRPRPPGGAGHELQRSPRRPAVVGAKP